MRGAIRLPTPVSGGLILSYKCSAECRHCIYACSPRRSADWISPEDLEKILGQLSGKILPNVHGSRTTGLSYGLHFTGGEPFLNFDLLCTAVEIAADFRIPSLFVETNCFWALDDEVTREKLRILRKKGLRGIMISVNPFFLEYVPFERTERAVRIGIDIFGRNVMVYQLEYFRRFRSWGFKDKIAFEEYLNREKGEEMFQSVEFFVTGRAPYRLRDILSNVYPPRPAEFFFGLDCDTPFLRNWHNHFDNYGNYVPGFCGGISLGDCRQLDILLKNGLDLGQFPVLGFLVDNDMKGLYHFARDHGYTDRPEGYLSKCHICQDIRRHLALQKNFDELRPKEFYLHLD